VPRKQKDAKDRQRKQKDAKKIKNGFLINNS
jgi:hypothetical protein